MARYSKVFSVFILFLGFKGVVFVAPLLFSFIHGVDEYILIEQSIAISLMVVPLVLLGLTASYTHWNLKYKNRKYNAVYRRYALGVSLCVFQLA